jgi:hypothetical protein
MLREGFRRVVGSIELRHFDEFGAAYDRPMLFLQVEVKDRSYKISQWDKGKKKPILLPGDLEKKPSCLPLPQLRNKCDLIPGCSMGATDL